MTDWLAKIGVNENEFISLNKEDQRSIVSGLVIAKSIIYLAEAITKGFDKINNNLAKIH